MSQEQPGPKGTNRSGRHHEACAAAVTASASLDIRIFAAFHLGITTYVDGTETSPVPSRREGSEVVPPIEMGKMIKNFSDHSSNDTWFTS
jgi:hypothetical protein